MTAKFYMQGGHVIVVKNVREVSMTRDPDGSYAAYEIKWKSNSPPLMTMSIKDIVAVSLEKTFWEKIFGR